MSPRNHSRSRRGDSTWFGSGTGFAVAAALLAAAATVMRGGVGFAESRWIAAAAWILGVAGLVGAPAARGRRDWGSRLAGVAVVALVGWWAFQCWPLPAGWAARVWRGNPTWLGMVAADAKGFCIAWDRFIALHEGLLWMGLGLLAWAASRQLRARGSLQVALTGLMLLGVGQTLAGIFFLPSAGGRLCGTFGSPDALGGLLAISLPVTLGLIFQRARRREMRGQGGWRWRLNRLATEWTEWGGAILWGCFAVQWAGLLFSGSMGATAAALAACVAMMAWRGSDHPNARSWMLAGALALGLLAIGFSIRGYRQNVLERSFGDPDAAWRTMASRVEIWRAAVRLCRAFPWGTGPGGTAQALPMAQTGSFGGFRLDYAHNDTLQCWGDLGPIGFGALAVLLALAGWRGGQGCRRSAQADGGRPVWLRRGAWAAFWAALLHAQVEFNLSARPGVQVAFALLCGILWAGGGGEDSDESGAAKPARRASWAGWAFSLALVAACGVAVALSCTAAVAWRLVEGAQRGLGKEVGKPEWFAAEAVPPEGALAAYRRANELAPGASAILRGEAEARMELHRQRVDEAARQIAGPIEPGEGESEPALDPLDPDHRQALDLAGLALRVEEVAMLREALAAADAAVAWSPWDAQARLVRARVLLRLAAILPAEEEAERRGRRDLELVAGLYPEDAGVLADACSVLALLGKTADRGSLLDWGGRVLALNAGLAGTVLGSWNAVGVSLEQMLEQPNQPPSVLWHLYVLLDRQRQSRGARRCLAALGKALEEDVPPPASTLWTPDMWKDWKRRQTTARLRWTRESLKHVLRMGDWEAVGQLDEARRRAWREQIQMDLDQDYSEGDTGIMRRLRLREWVAQGRLPSNWVVEWAETEVQADQSAGVLQEPVAELLLMDELDGDDLRRLLALRGKLADAPFLAALLDAKESEQNGAPETALNALNAWLAGIRTVPRRLSHRLWLWEARLQSKAGDSTQAANALALAAERCPTDPDVRAALGAGRGDAVEPTMDIRYKGGRLRLRGAWFEEPSEERVNGAYHLDWRFQGLLPSDLRVELRIRDGQERVLYRKSAAVDGEFDAFFNHGAPALGSAWRWAVEVPPRAAAGERLDIVVFSGALRVSTDEGLPLLELDASALPRIGSSTKETIERAAE